MKSNTYVCTTCNGSIVTRNDDVGTTPFMLRCRATRGCQGFMESQFGRVKPGAMPTHEWYLRTDFDKMTDEESLHATRGGAFIRRITEVGPGDRLSKRPKTPKLQVWRRRK